MAKQRTPVGQYCFNLAVAFDRLLNALSGGSHDETLSSRAHRMRDEGRPYWSAFAWLIDTGFFWQDDHCWESWVNECQRRNPAAEHMSSRRETVQ
jgi:hypothetical protein